MKKINNLAFDLGASSGRLILSEYDGCNISLKELHRFSNNPVKMNGHIYWNIFSIFEEIKNGLQIAAAQNIEIHGLGLDTWGVDYALLDKNDNLIGLPFAYRDTRTENAINEVAGILPLEEIYNSTGIQFLNFNTLFQFYSDKQIRRACYDNAAYYLSLPDFLNFCLTGQKFNEYTHASTTQILNAKERNWDFPLLEKLGLRTDIFSPMIFPGDTVGVLTKALQQELSLPPIPVYAVGSHDTASAVAGTPLIPGTNSAFLSCGTWSLLGLELDSPIISKASFDSDFTNEGGVENTIRLLKNINGLFIIQQLRSGYNKKNNAEITFADIMGAARSAKNNSFCIEPSDNSFMSPEDMQAAISCYCEKNSQGIPEGLGETAVAVYNGLTREYNKVVTTLEQLIRKPIANINMIGGGIQDEFLCSQTAIKTGKTVLAGPVEGSALGNVIMQLKASGHIKNISEGREIIRNSFPVKTYCPDGSQYD